MQLIQLPLNRIEADFCSVVVLSFPNFLSITTVSGEIWQKMKSLMDA